METLALTLAVTLCLAGAAAVALCTLDTLFP